jgi:hypothetical protein
MLEYMLMVATAIISTIKDSGFRINAAADAPTQGK